MSITLAILLLSLVSELMAATNASTRNVSICIFEACLCEDIDASEYNEDEWIVATQRNRKSVIAAQQEQRIFLKTVTCDARLSKKLNPELATRFPKRFTYNKDRQEQLFSSEIDILKVSNYDFGLLPDCAFRDLSVHALILEQNNLQAIRANSFYGIARLKTLIIREKSLNIIETGAFAHFKSTLVDLSLSECELTNEMLYRLKELIDSCQRLKSLDLSKNRLSGFLSKWFPNSRSQLMSLNLAHNQIATLDSQAFLGMNSLEFLSLKGNLLRGELDQQPLSSLQASLVKLDLSNNFVARLPLPFGYFSKLIALDLSSNFLRTVEADTFILLFNLNVLDLSENQIELVDERSFATLVNLVHLKLNGNRLSYVPCIRKMNSLMSLDMSNQNGFLISLSDYQFERENTVSSAMLTVNLRSNNIALFDKRTFCGRHHHIGTLLISRDTLNALVQPDRACLLGQLTRGDFDVVVDVTKEGPYTPYTSVQESDEPQQLPPLPSSITLAAEGTRITTSEDVFNNYCSCDLLVYARNSGVNITGQSGCENLTCAMQSIFNGGGHASSHLDRMCKEDAGAVAAFKCPNVDVFATTTRSLESLAQEILVNHTKQRTTTTTAVSLTASDADEVPPTNVVLSNKTLTASSSFINLNKSIAASSVIRADNKLFMASFVLLLLMYKV